MIESVWFFFLQESAQWVRALNSRQFDQFSQRIVVFRLFSLHTSCTNAIDFGGTTKWKTIQCSCSYILMTEIWASKTMYQNKVILIRLLLISIIANKLWRWTFLQVNVPELLNQQIGVCRRKKIPEQKRKKNISRRTISTEFICEMLFIIF